MDLNLFDYLPGSRSMSPICVPAEAFNLYSKRKQAKKMLNFIWYRTCVKVDFLNVTTFFPLLHLFTDHFSSRVSNAYRKCHSEQYIQSSTKEKAKHFEAAHTNFMKNEIFRPFINKGGCTNKAIGENSQHPTHT